MTAPVPPSLADAFMRFCRGDHAYRLPRTFTRDASDAQAFFFNAVADELERIIDESRAQEKRLVEVADRLSEALIRVASGDLGVRLERDEKGDVIDVLLFLVNNTIDELAHLVAERERAAARERDELQRLVDERTAQLKELAVTDVLTGAMNRRRLFEVAEELRAEAERYGRPACLAMLDLDRFKLINDEFGHVVGDRALAASAEAIRGALRQVDKLGRYGGEELTLLLPETELDAALVVAERVREAVAGLALVHEGRRVPLTLSGGVIQLRPGESLLEAIDRADAALYRAKAAGRDRVERG